MQTISKRGSANDQVSSVIMIHLCIMNCKNILVATSSFFSQFNDRLNLLIMVVFAIMYARLVIKTRLLNKIPTVTYITIIFLAAFIAVSCFFDRKLFVSNVFPYSFVPKQFRTFIAYCFPLFIATSALTDIGILMKKLYASIYIMIPFVLFGLFCSLLSSESSYEYSMSYGYSVLYVFCLLLIKSLSIKSWKDSIFRVICVIAIVLVGSRGPFACVIAAYFIAATQKPLTMGRCVLWIFLLIIAAIFMVAYKEILNGLALLLDSMNISSRTVRMLINGQITYDSGRNEYYEVLIAAINKSPLIGLGAFGGEKTVGKAHNLYLDVFANFGYVLGGIFLAILLYRVVCVLATRRRDYCEILWLLLMLTGIRGFFSDSFWATKELWMIMGVLISYAHTRRVERYYKN